MKFILSFKTPDVMDQLDDLTQNQMEDAKTVAKKFLKYDEYISVEFDTKLKTATVMEQM